MNILDRIIADKKKEVRFKKEILPIKYLEQSPLFGRPSNSLAQAIQKKSVGIIAEHKRRSPSKSVINQNSNVWEVAIGYEEAGASGMSVLTDVKYFGGALEDLNIARNNTSFPLLRKDFIIDEYQLVEAKAHGADVCLLIAACLSREEIKRLSVFAKSLELDVLLEVHNEEELHKSLMPSLDLLGVNNRNLKTFEVSLETSKALSELIPSDFVKVSESGISSVEAIEELQQFGYQGFLIGENFMKSDDPAQSIREFMKAFATV